MERGSAIGVGFASIPGSAAQVLSWDHRDLNFSTNLLYSTPAALAAAGSPAGAVTYEDEATLGAINTNDLLGEDANQLGQIDLARNHGAKVIMWQGTADQLIRWRDSLDFYRRAAVRTAAMAPRISRRCSRGSAISTRRAQLTALRAWGRLRS
jgi:hypothetical protein